MKLEIKRKVNSAAAKLGSLGGKAFVKKFGKRKMKELAKRGAQARWGNK